MRVDNSDLMLISIVLPVYNEELNLSPLHSNITKVFSNLDHDYEIIFVDNGSTDTSLEIIKKLRSEDNKVHFLSLSRNFGHQGGLFAGLTYANGDATITLDADLQHPPSLISEMIKLWEHGFQVVYTNKIARRPRTVTQIQTRLFYYLISKLSGLNVTYGQSDFRLLDRKVLNCLIQIPEYKKFLRGTISWLGFRQTSLEYEESLRYSGTSKFSYRSLLSFAIDGILSFSTLPLRVFTAAGIIIAASSFLYAIIVVILVSLKQYHNLQIPPGWSALAIAISFFGAVQLIAVGVLGEYICRIYDQTKGRPVFIVDDTSYEELSHPKTNRNI